MSKNIQSTYYLSSQQKKIYDVVKLAEFKLGEVSNNHQNSIINKLGLKQFLWKIESKILDDISDYYRNGEIINEKNFKSTVSNNIKPVFEKTKIAIDNKIAENISISNNTSIEINFKLGDKAKIDIHNCYVYGKYDLKNYVLGYFKIIDNLRESLVRDRDEWVKHSNKGYLRWMLVVPFITDSFTMIRYRAKSYSYVAAYEQMINNIDVLKMEMLLNLNSSFELLHEVEKAHEFISKDNPNLINFSTRYLAFLDNAGKFFKEEKKPLVLSLTIEELKEFKNLLIEWYKNKKN